MKLMFFLAILVLTFQPSLFADPVLGLYGGGVVSRMFKNKDSNEDAKITEKEFLAHAKKKFKKMDTNKDGYVSPKEAKAFHSHRHQELMKSEKKKGGKPQPHSHD